jgi:uncharacterized lipoprotein YddW (UPF0748 family)
MIKSPINAMSIRAAFFMIAIFPAAGCGLLKSNPATATAATTTTAPATRPVYPTGSYPPPAPREFRAVWVASVNNGNWPSRRGLSVEEQKKEMLHILDRAVELHMNAVIFHVRPQCDALYDSKIEPWSEYLTGTQGKAPEPYYDPLTMWIEEAHKRGLELHASFNPYRAGRVGEEFAPNHVSKTHPEIVRTYGRQLWLDPADPATIDYSISVFMDVVKRYDVDGVHMDDYFYPYKVRAELPATTRATSNPATTAIAAATEPSTQPATTEATTQGRRRRRFGNQPRPRPENLGPPLDFPDEPTWTKYQQSGGKLSRNDWRRASVNTFIHRLYDSVKNEKKWVKMGISPFGIWRPQNPPGVEGLDAYNELYADSRLWFSKGWCDYFSPQLYWPIEGRQSFPALLGWWAKQNNSGRHLWPGISVGRHDVDEVLDQIAITRKQRDPGVIHWSVNSVLRREELCAALVDGPYRQRALVPASKWLDSTAPSRPSAAAYRQADGSAAVTLNSAGEAPWQWAIWSRHGKSWKFDVLPGSQTEAMLPNDPTLGPINSLVITAVDRCGNESPRVTISVGAGL